MADEGYTVKEIVDLTRQEQTRGFTEVKTLLAGKADKADLIPIHDKLGKHDERLRTLEDGRLVTAAVDKKVGETKSRHAAFWGLVVAAGTAVGTIVYAVIYAIH